MYDTDEYKLIRRIEDLAWLFDKGEDKEDKEVFLNELAAVRSPNTPILARSKQMGRPQKLHDAPTQSHGMVEGFLILFGDGSVQCTIRDNKYKTLSDLFDEPQTHALQLVPCWVETITRDQFNTQVLPRAIVEGEFSR